MLRPDHIRFANGTPITLGTDFVELRKQAVAFEEKHGADKGHGWLLRHPITKLTEYQKDLYLGNYKSKKTGVGTGSNE